VSLDAERVLSQFIDEWSAGERPDVAEHLARVDAPSRGELAEQLAAFLAVAPSVPAAMTDTARIDALSFRIADAMVEPAGLLRRWRLAASLELGEVGARVLAAVGLDRREGERAGRYVDRLERGELDPTGVTARARQALARALGITLADLESALTPAPAAALYRREAHGGADDIAVLADALAAEFDEPHDAVDELFLGGR
jgi:transcriptional regulator with XRE-family HTH domain